MTGLVRWLFEQPLPVPPERLRRGPLRDGAFAPRSTRLTSQLGLMLGLAFGVCFVTGLLSHLVQHPPGWFWWPSRPAGLYRVTQGVHVATGLASIPLLGAKLWSVYPRLFTWPPARDVRHALERAGVAALVAGGLFQLVSGVLNISRWYTPMPFFFTTGHYWVAWLTAGALLVHVSVQLPVVRSSLGLGTRREKCRTRVLDSPHPVEGGVAPPASAEGSVALPASAEGSVALPASEEGSDVRAAGTESAAVRAVDAESAVRAAGTESAVVRAADGESAVRGAAVAGKRGEGELARREVLLGAGIAAGVITLATVGQTVRPLDRIAVLAPRRPTIGPQGLPVNKTAVAAGVREDPAYVLTVTGPAGPIRLGLEALNDLPQHTVVLPIACVEGWSATATWTGVRLRDLVEMAGADPGRAHVLVESMQRGGRYRSSAVEPPLTADPFTLLALRLRGEVLHLDHGYPVRLIAPNRPGVLQTKWVSRLTVTGER
jgi:DMSO/TMAO reductase YedYZ molybdopterin-dependent catalytic subunit